MKNKILLFVFIITFSSCSIFQKTQTVSQNVETSTSEPEDSLQKFVGNYDIAVFGLPDGSDLIVAMNVSKNGDGLTTVFTSDEANQGFEILRTEVEDDILERRDEMIADIEARLKQEIERNEIFTVRWAVV